MNTIDKIRAEIERLYGEYKAKFHQNGDSYHLGIIDGLDMAERMLDTLEEPVSDDLEEAADEYSNDPYIGFIDMTAYRAFKAGAEWQKRKMMEGATYNELMELYRAIRDELVKRHRDVPINIKEEQ